MTNPKQDVDEAAMREVLAKLFWDWTRGPELGGPWEQVSDNTIAKKHARDFADEIMRRVSTHDLQRESKPERNEFGAENHLQPADFDKIDLQRENKRLREALDSIRVYGADTLSGRSDSGANDAKWYGEGVLEMTKRARAALNPASDGSSS